MAIIGHPATGARQLGAQSLAQAGSLRDQAVNLRLARLRELQRDRDKLLSAVDRLRQRREAKKAAEAAEPALGGWGAAGGAGTGALIGMIGGPAGMLVGAGLGAALGGGVEQAMSGDVAGGTESIMEGTQWGVEAVYDYSRIPNRWRPDLPAGTETFFGGVPQAR